MALDMASCSCVTKGIGYGADWGTRSWRSCWRSGARESRCSRTMSTGTCGGLFPTTDSPAGGGVRPPAAVPDSPPRAGPSEAAGLAVPAPPVRQPVPLCARRALRESMLQIEWKIRWFSPGNSCRIYIVKLLTICRFSCIMYTVRFVKK